MGSARSGPCRTPEYARRAVSALRGYSVPRARREAASTPLLEFRVGAWIQDAGIRVNGNVLGRIAVATTTRCDSTIRAARIPSGFPDAVITQRKRGLAAPPEPVATTTRASAAGIHAARIPSPAPWLPDVVIHVIGNVVWGRGVTFRLRRNESTSNLHRDASELLVGRCGTSSAGCLGPRRPRAVTALSASMARAAPYIAEVRSAKAGSYAES